MRTLLANPPLAPAQSLSARSSHIEITALPKYALSVIQGRIVKKSKAKWLIGFVNYYTKDLIDFQLKALSRSRRRKALRVIIVDNSSNSEEEQLKAIIRKHGFTGRAEIINNSHSSLVGSYAHAEGLNRVLKAANGEEWLLTQDPDFFWFAPDHLRFLEKLLKGDVVAAGSPYQQKVGFGAPDFPSAWGAAYRLDLLEPDDFLVGEHSLSKDFCQPDFGFSQDVGWRIRQRLSEKRFVAFDQRLAFELSDSFGSHSFVSWPMEYFYRGAPVAIHLFRGSFPTGLDELEKQVAKGTPPTAANATWNDVKLKFAKTADVISRGPLPRLAYQYFCARKSRQPREIIARNFNPYYFVQRLVFPYAGQREYLSKLQSAVRTEVARQIHEQLAVLRDSPKDSVAVRSQLFHCGPSKSLETRLEELFQHYYGVEAPRTDVARMTTIIRTGESLSENDFERWLSGIEHDVDVADWASDFDQRYAAAVATSKLLYFMIAPVQLQAFRQVIAGAIREQIGILKSWQADCLNEFLVLYGSGSPTEIDRTLRRRYFEMYAIELSDELYSAMEGRLRSAGGTSLARYESWVNQIEHDFCESEWIGEREERDAAGPAVAQLLRLILDMMRQQIRPTVPV